MRTARGLWFCAALLTLSQGGLPPVRAQDYPGGFRAHFARAQSAQSSGEQVGHYSAALAAWTRRDGLEAKAGAHLNRGIAYHEMKRYDLAIRDYGKAIKLRPKNASAYRNRAAAYRQTERYDKAIRDYTRAIGLMPQDPELHLYRGVALAARDQNEDAVRDFSRSIELDPSNPQAYSNRGRAHYAQGRFELAAQDYEKAIQLNPADNYARHNLQLAIERSKPRRMGDDRFPETDAELAPPITQQLPRAKTPLLLEPQDDLGLAKTDSVSSALNEMKPLVNVKNGLIAAGAVLVLIGLFFAFHKGRQTSRRRKTDPLRIRIGELCAQAQKDPGPDGPIVSEELAGAYREYRRAGGRLDGLEAEHLALVLLAQDVDEASDSLPPQKTLKLSRILSESGKHKRGVELLSDDVVKAAASMAGAPDQIVQVCERAGKLGVFVARQVDSFRAPRFYTEFARALLRLGKHQEALSMINKKDPGAWSPEDVLTAFELRVRLGHTDQALAMLPRVGKIKPLESNPGLHYRLARAAEESGQTRVALALYGPFAEKRVDYEDAQARHAQLQTLVQLDEEAVKTGPKPTAAPPSPRVEPSKPVTPPEPAAALGGKYLLGKQIGEGGMGAVYEAHDRTIGRRVAIKKMHSALRENAEARKRFLQGARITSHLTHPYIVSIHDIIEESGDVYLVFDYIDGKPLSAILEERERFSLKECKRIFKQVCEAIAAAHEARILHRDLKPGNIMLDVNGFAKVMDFDIAREAKETISRLTQRDTSGTPAYMAPEQHLGEAHRSSDVFALAVTLYEMLTGKLPFTGPDFLAQKERKKFTPPNFLAPDLPKGIELFMASALEPDPQKRIADPLELFEALSEL